MDVDIHGNELWENYQTMADNLLSLTANLPETLQARALDDLRNRLPGQDAFLSSCLDTPESDYSAPTRRKRGRPRKIHQTQEVAADESAKSQVVSSTPSSTNGSSQLVIRTRRQRHVELHGEEAPRQGFRSPMVALLGTRLPPMAGEPKSSTSSGKMKSKTQERTQIDEVIGDLPQSSTQVSNGNEITHLPAEIETGESIASPSSPVYVVQLFTDESNIGPISSEVSVVVAVGQDPIAAVSSIPAPVEQDSLRGLETFPVPSSPESSVASPVTDEGRTSGMKRCINLSEFVDIVTAEAKRQGEYTRSDVPNLASSQRQPSQVVILRKTCASPNDIGENQQSVDTPTETIILGGNSIVKAEPMDVENSDEAVMAQNDTNHIVVPSGADINLDFQHSVDVIGELKEKKKRGRKCKVIATHQCPECPEKLFSRDMLRVHLKSHKSFYKCEMCGRKFCFKYKYEAHIEVHLSGNFHKCPHCANNVRGLDRLEQHIRDRHPGFEMPQNTQPSSDTAPQQPASGVLPTTLTPEVLIDNPTPEVLTDNTTPESFTNNVTNHDVEQQDTSAETPLMPGELPQFTDAATPNPSNPITSNSAPTHNNNPTHNNPIPTTYNPNADNIGPDDPTDTSSKQTAAKRCAPIRVKKQRIPLTGGRSKYKNQMRHECFECKLVFRSMKKLACHQKDVHGKLPSICPVCHRRFLYRSSFEEHMDEHTNGLLKPCGIGECMFYYKNAIEYKRHTLRAHSEEAPRPYVCTTCNKSFWELRYLKTHIHNHKKTKIYTCETCFFETYNIHSLRRHLINKHQMTIAHICDLCGAKLRCKSTLQDHIKRHFNQKTAVCQVCSKAFINRSQLSMHMRVHKRPEYICSVCGKESKTRSKMINHMLIHAKLKPYACHVEYCNYNCRVKSNLFKHMERVHHVQHPDKFSTYRYVEQVHKYTNQAAMDDASPNNHNKSNDPGLTQYVCAFHDCNYQALTEDAVAKHQLRVHTLLKDVMQNLDPNEEPTFQFSGLPLEEALGCTTGDISETFESMNIPVPVEEISEQTEAAHTLARLQNATTSKTDIDSMLQANEEGLGLNPDPGVEGMEQLPVLSIPEATVPDRQVCYVKLDDDTIQGLVSIPDSSDTSVQYIQLEDGTIQKIETQAVPESIDSKPEVQYIHLDESAQKIMGSQEKGLSTMYIVRMENEGSENTILDSDYLEMFARSNVINLDPGTILMNEQGSVVKIVD